MGEVFDEVARLAPAKLAAEEGCLQNLPAVTVRRRPSTARGYRRIYLGYRAHGIENFQSRRAARTPP